MSKVVPFTGVTTLDFDPDFILDQAKGMLDSCVVVGIDKEGHDYFASSVADGGTVVWVLERAKHSLMREADND